MAGDSRYRADRRGIYGPGGVLCVPDGPSAAYKIIRALDFYDEHHPERPPMDSRVETAETVLRVALGRITALEAFIDQQKKLNDDMLPPTRLRIFVEKVMREVLDREVQHCVDARVSALVDRLRT